MLVNLKLISEPVCEKIAEEQIYDSYSYFAYETV